MRSRSSRVGGFTLLEVMVALGILAVSLTWLVESTTRAIAATNHAKLISTATFLCRARLVELEDELAEKGFTDDSFSKEAAGDFDEKGFKRFKWTTVIDKIELPNTDQVQTLVSKGIENQQTTLGQIGQANGGTIPPVTGPGSALGATPLGGSAGMLGSQFGIIKDVLEQSIRRARVKITWLENGREQVLEITEYLTDPRRVDQSINLGGLAAMGANGKPGAGPAGANGQSPTGGVNSIFGGGGAIGSPTGPGK